MKDSEIYRILQELVVNTPGIETSDKLNMLRLLFEQEELALYTESKEEQEESKDAEI